VNGAERYSRGTRAIVFRFGFIGKSAIPRSDYLLDFGPYPRLNGKVERSHQTDKDEF